MLGVYCLDLTLYDFSVGDYFPAELVKNKIKLADNKKKLSKILVNRKKRHEILIFNFEDPSVFN